MEQLTELEIADRRRAIRNAIGTHALEGLKIDARTLIQMDRHARGEIEVSDILEDVRRRVLAGEFNDAQAIGVDPQTQTELERMASGEMKPSDVICSIRRRIDLDAPTAPETYRDTPEDTARLAQEIEASLADRRPNIPHDAAMAEVDQVIEAAGHRAAAQVVLQELSVISKSASSQPSSK